ncbi:MAG: hypothetical protein JOZ90_15510 [Alphaproteobacteria bacterium]|nr:hypothetical protein [Alphaproteobacteria bacterium]MBV9371705.1 hypothetical protein [Alphaproteobacteria bacterium]MBV9902481.1 hypothetical protein [Alphaproteobacteria bacterium]
MRAMSDRELELVIGGYSEVPPEDYYSATSDGSADGYDVTLTNYVDQSTVDQAAANADTMSSEDFASYATESASSLGVNIGGGVTVTPIITHPLNPDKRTYKLKFSVPC